MFFITFTNSNEITLKFWEVGLTKKLQTDLLNAKINFTEKWANKGNCKLHQGYQYANPYTKPIFLFNSLLVFYTKATKSTFLFLWKNFVKSKNALNLHIVFSTPGKQRCWALPSAARRCQQKFIFMIIFVPISLLQITFQHFLVWSESV